MKLISLFPEEKNEKEPLVFENQSGKLFYVKAHKTKTGKTTFVITKQLSDDCVSELPDSYEVADIPTSGQLVVRKKLPTLFTSNDTRIIESELKKNKALYTYKIDIRGNVLSIFVKQIQDESPFKIFGNSIPLSMIMKTQNFDELMRVKIAKRGTSMSYFFERYNFRGSYDDWMPIGAGNDLKELAQRFIKHIGHESYFEIGYGI